MIHHDQTGFLPGRYIVENVMKIMNLMEFCERQDKSIVILSLDFEKAFDKLEFKVVELTMEAFGIGQKFIDMVKILYNEPLSCTMNNGYWLNWFIPTRSCCQDDPISSLIFMLTSELLGNSIRVNIYKGVTMNRYNLKNVHYTDDLWLVLHPSADNINELLRELERFTKFSGLTINYEKSVAKIIGPLST